VTKHNLNVSNSTSKVIDVFKSKRHLQLRSIPHVTNICRRYIKIDSNSSHVRLILEVMTARKFGTVEFYKWLQYF